MLVSSHRKNAGKLAVPSIAYFDHMVSCGSAGSRGFCVDLTDPYTTAESRPIYISGAISLPPLQYPMWTDPSRSRH